MIAILKPWIVGTGQGGSDGHVRHNWYLYRNGEIQDAKAGAGWSPVGKMSVVAMRSAGQKLRSKEEMCTTRFRAKG